MSTPGPLDRFRTPGSASKHRKGRSSSECIRKSDGVTLQDARAPAVRIFVMNGQEEEIAPTQKTPRDQVPEENESAPGSTGRLFRRKSVNLGSPLPGPQTQARSFYDFVGVIGEGKTSQVYYGVNHKTQEKVAIKVIDRRRLIANPDLVTEVNVLKKLSHPNIVRLIDVFITPENLQIVMELCEGHELFDEIVDRRTFNEGDARDLIKQVLKPLEYLHAQGIAHRDLKPENIMFVSEEDTKHIKLLDFGFAKAVSADNEEVSMVGTLGYKAPEIFKSEPYSTKCDMWALGVITYILLCGFPPFFSEEHYKDMVNNAPFWFFFNDETPLLVDQIKRGVVSYPEANWSKLSPQAKAFVQSLLVVDPLKRATAKEALAHPWMTWKPSAHSKRADLFARTPTMMQRLRDGVAGGGGIGNTQNAAGFSIGPSASRIATSSRALLNAFAAAPDPLAAIRVRIERHILGESHTRGISLSADWERTEGDDEDWTDVKYRLLASYDTQEAQWEMLSALDPKTLHQYVRQRKGSFGSRMTRPTTNLKSTITRSSTGKLRHRRFSI